MKELLEQDLCRYADRKGMSEFQKYFRLAQSTPQGIRKKWYEYKYRKESIRTLNEIPLEVSIGGGMYMGHPTSITINSKAVLGKNINIHKGVTIGGESRGERQGNPTIGDNVWIGIGAVIVGKIMIGNDVLIAPNSYVNCDVPEHSVVFGNPCIIKYKDRATEGYLKNLI